MMSFEPALWCFMLALTLHNLEEAIWLPAWSKLAGRWHEPIGAFEFGFAVLMLTALALVAAMAALGTEWRAWGTHVVCGYAAAMLVNVFVPHVAGTFMLRRYAPGTATAVLLNLPATLALLLAALREGRIAPAELAWAALAVTAGLLLLIPLLFWLGRYTQRVLVRAGDDQRSIRP